MARTKKSKPGSKKRTAGELHATSVEQQGMKKHGAEVPDSRPAKKSKQSHDKVQAPVTPSGVLIAAESKAKSNLLRTEKPPDTANVSEQSLPDESNNVHAKPNDISTSACAHYELDTSHNIKTMSVLSSSSMRKIIAGIVEQLAPAEPSSHGNPRLVRLHAWASNASKLISIVEIAKRELRERGVTWYQYTAIEAVLSPYVEKPYRDRAVHRVDQSTADAEGEKAAEVVEQATALPDEQRQAGSGDEEAFEQMAPRPSPTVSTEQRHKVRNIPRMWIFMATKSIASLKKLYGQQSSLDK